MDILSYILGKKAGGGGGEAVLINKSVTANGTYNASSDSADGYKKVVVSVPASAVDTGTKSITSNGNGQDVVGYAAVDVAVPNSYAAGDEGKVVSNGALVAQGSDTVTANDTYDTTLISSLTVNVSGGGGGESALLSSLLEGTASGEVYSESLTKIVVDSVMTGSKSKNVTKINLPNVTTVGTNFCYQHPNVTEIKMPKLESTPITAFGYLPNAITVLVFQSLKVIGAQAFRNGKFSAFDCLGGSTGSFGGNSFVGCASLDTFIIRADTVMPLGNINNFDSTCFASGKSGGTLYVPNDLISGYQGASNWSTILGYANNQIKSIESTHTDPNAPIDLTLYYADGTPIS